MGVEYWAVVLTASSLIAFLAYLAFGVFLVMKTGDAKALREAGAFVRAFRGAAAVAVAEAVGKTAAALAAVMRVAGASETAAHGRDVFRQGAAGSAASYRRWRHRSLASRLGDLSQS